MDGLDRGEGRGGDVTRMDVGVVLSLCLSLGLGLEGRMGCL